MKKMIFCFTAFLFFQNVFAQPTISSFLPTSGPVGTMVTITGTGFAATVADNIVYFGSIRTTVLAATNATLIVTVPKGASYKPVSVTSNNLTAFSSEPFIVTFGTGDSPFDNNSFEHAADFGLLDSPFGACAGDFDADGKSDFAVAEFGIFENSFVSIFKNTSGNNNVNFTTRADINSALYPHDCGAGDLDGDGKLDVVLVNYGAGSVSVLRNTSLNGIISFATAINYTTGSRPRIASIADFDLDGKPDIAVTNFASNSLTVFRNMSSAGNISFSVGVNYTTGSNPFGISVADFDGDNKPDLAVTNYESGSVSVLKNNSSTGNINFDTRIDFPCGSNPRSIYMADLDHNGRPEMIVANYGSSSISVLNNTSSVGSISFSARVDYATGNGPTYISVGDLDGDGEVDIAVANMDDNTISVYKNKGSIGSITLADKVDLATGTSPRCVIIQDVNGDSKPDLAIVSNNDKNFSVLMNKMEEIKIIASPAIASLSPTAAGPYTSILIAGTNFDDVSAVTFGGMAADSFSVISPAVISAFVGLGASGDVAVTTPYGTGALSGFVFNAPPPPAISNFEPDTATTNTIVTITGTEFYGVRAVLFGGTPADTFVVKSPTTILATVGTGSTGDITVSTAFGTNSVSGFTYFPSPAITSFSPETAAIDTTVTITGMNLENATQVSFGGVPASSFTIVNATTIKAIVGNNGASGNIEITTPGGTASKAGFTFTPLPFISSFAPVSGPSGGSITIKGSNLTGASAVTFGGTEANSFTVVDSVTIHAVVGTGSTGDILVTTSGGIATKPGFTFIPSPTITSFTPDTATTGTNISITGTNFTGVTEVQFGGVTAASFVVNSPTSITAEIGVGASGAVSVTTPGGRATGNALTYTIPPPPSISSFTPTSGTTGTIITITGDHLKGTTNIQFGAISADSIAIISQTTLKAVVAVGSTGEVSVTTPGGTTTMSGFTFVAPIAPTITSFSPTSGFVGSNITITGTNFNPVVANNIVYFGAVRAIVTSATGSSLTVLVPAGATYCPISVTTSDYTACSKIPFIVKFNGIGNKFTSQSFALKTGYAPGGDPNRVAITDLDGDGKPDMAVAERSTGSVSIYRNTSINNEFSFAPKINYHTGNNTVAVEAGDFNGDGKPDLVVVNSLSITVKVLKNQSSPGLISFAMPESAEPRFIYQGWDLKIADLDGDGKLDIAVAYYDANIISIFRNRSSSSTISFYGSVDIPVNSGAFSFSIGDIDGDGKPDIALPNNDAKTVSIFRNTSAPGTFSFTSESALATDYPVTGVAFGDLDGDDKLDLAVSNYDAADFSSYTVSVFRSISSAGTISFDSKIDYAAGGGDSQVHIADMDGDGKPDLATTNRSTYSVSVLKNNSTTETVSFAPKIDYPTGSYLSSLSIGDLDGDGKPDLIASQANGILSSVSILRNTIGEPNITPSGSNPVSGAVIKNLTIDETVQTYNGFPYVQRHYDVEPLQNPRTATATVTLYFTQQDFDNFNAHPAHSLNLPLTSDDATGKANLRVYQYHGFSTTSQPGSYAGSGIEINPDDDKIVWNGTNQWWEISVNVTGFSGFFIGSAGSSILPLKLLSFTGKVEGASVFLKWKTAEQINTAYFEVQRSNDGRNFVNLYKVPAAVSTTESPVYYYTDLLGTEAVYYYRLKVVDIDNNFTYSSAITIKQHNNKAGLILYPNPSNGFTVVNHPASSSYTQIKIINMTGRVIKTVRADKNTARTRLNITGVTAGVYKIIWTDGVKILNQTLLIE